MLNNLSIFFLCWIVQAQEPTKRYWTLHTSSMGGHLSCGLSSGLLPIYGRKKFHRFFVFLNYRLLSLFVYLFRPLDQNFPIIGSTFIIMDILAIGSVLLFIPKGELLSVSFCLCYTPWLRACGKHKCRIFLLIFKTYFQTKSFRITTRMCVPTITCGN